MPVEVVVRHTLNFWVYSIMTALADLFRNKTTLKGSTHILSTSTVKAGILKCYWRRAIKRSL